MKAYWKVQMKGKEVNKKKKERREREREKKRGIQGVMGTFR